MSGDGKAGGMAVVILGLVVLGLVWGGKTISEFFADEPAPDAQPAEAPLDPAAAARAPEASAAPEPEGGGAGLAGSRSEASRPAYPRPAKALSAEARAERLAAILAKLGSPAEGRGAEAEDASSDAASPDTSEVKGSLSKTVIQDAVREVIPLVKECYELALAEQAGVQGRLTVKFEIVGDEEYGGLVTSSEIVTPEGEAVPSALLAECVRESIYAIDLPVPTGGGKVVVNYPFVFKTAPEPGAN